MLSCPAYAADRAACQLALTRLGVPFSLRRVLGSVGGFVHLLRNQCLKQLHCSFNLLVTFDGYAAVAILSCPPPSSWRLAVLATQYYCLV